MSSERRGVRPRNTREERRLRAREDLGQNLEEVVPDLGARHVQHELLATLGVLPSHSRPHVSDDNPFSEAQFKTLKYTGPPSRRASARSRIPRASATASSPGTTLSIAMSPSA